MFEGVDIEVGRAVEGGEEVADAGGVINPARPGDVGFLKVNIGLRTKSKIGN